MSQWWSWLLAAIGIFGLYLAGKRNLYGWVIGIGVQVLWIAYAIATRQWGFIASALAYAAVNLRNYIRWNNEAKVVENERHS
ncbi:MAG TPA: hypothetical protein VGD31_15685 [Sphingobacteriaceae bacterium]